MPAGDALKCLTLPVIKKLFRSNAFTPKENLFKEVEQAKMSYKNKNTVFLPMSLPLAHLQFLLHVVLQ